MASSRVIKVFFSYKWADGYDTVEQVYDMLSDEYNIEIWRDTRRLLVGQNIDAKICEGIDGSDVFVCFLSRIYYEGEVERNKCLQEFRYATSSGRRLVFVMLDNISINDLPEMIRFHATANLRLNAYQLPNEYAERNGTKIDYICHELKRVFRNERIERDKRRSNGNVGYNTTRLPSNTSTTPAYDSNTASYNVIKPSSIVQPTGPNIVTTSNLKLSSSNTSIKRSNDQNLAAVRNIADRVADVAEAIIPKERRPESLDMDEYRNNLRDIGQTTYSFLNFLKKVKDN